jgi:5-methylcytosine-specific restriction endonuclease McrA
VDRHELRRRLKALPYARFLGSTYWRTIRQIVFVRDKFRCFYCLASEVPLEVHHTTYKHLGEDYLHFETLRAACTNCHGWISAMQDLGCDINDEEFAAKRRKAFASAK